MLDQGFWPESVLTPPTDEAGLDNMRLFIDSEGGEHTAMTDLYAVHNYALTAVRGI